MKKLFLLLIVFFSINTIAAELRPLNFDYQSNVLVGSYDVYSYDKSGYEFKYRTPISTLLDTGFGDFIKIDVYHYCTGNLIYSQTRTSGNSFGTVPIPPFLTDCKQYPNKFYYANIEYSIGGTYGNHYLEYN